MGTTLLNHLLEGSAGLRIALFIEGFNSLVEGPLIAFCGPDPAQVTFGLPGVLSLHPDNFFKKDTRSREIALREQVDGLIPDRLLVSLLARPSRDLLNILIHLGTVLGVLQGEAGAVGEFLFGLVKLLLLKERHSLLKEFFLEGVSLLRGVTHGVQVGIYVFVARVLLFDLLEELAGVLHLGCVE